jgi:CelD/BcsL family acetyltransferase involved in cellulose biosynthesis
LRLILLREIPEDANLRQQWNELVARTDQPQVFYAWEWALAVQRAYCPPLRPLLFLAYDERESLCGVAALAADPACNKVSFLCATTGDYCDFLALPEYKSAFVSEVLAELRKQGVGEVTLTNLPADSDTVTALRLASAENGYYRFARTAYVCTQIALDRLRRQPDDKPLAPGQKRIRRLAKAMAHDGPVRFDHSRSWDSVAPILPQFIQAHVARFLATGRISNLADSRRRVFLAGLAELLTTAHWMVLSRLILGERVVAWHYGFQFHDTWFWYQPTFDSNLEKYWPGFCLLTQVIQEATENLGLTKVDLGLGSEPYKAKFSNQTRETLYVALNASAIQHCRRALHYHAAEIVKASPRAEAAARTIRERWRRVRQHIRRQGAAVTLFWLMRRFRDLFWSASEVFFYEWQGSVRVAAESLRFQTLSLNDLASATLQYASDEASLNYLLRAAAHLREGNAEGYGLADQGGVFVHFAWVTAFDGFRLSELNAKVEAPSPDCVMLFDCWTPPAARGHGYYGQTVALVADRMRKNGKKPWIFSAASNVASMRGLEKAGFQLRYSLVRQRVMGWQRVKTKNMAPLKKPAAEVPANV